MASLPEPADFPAFRAHPLLRNGHAMTFALLLPRGRRVAAQREERDLRLADGDGCVHAVYHWNPDPHAPALILVHGLTGSAQSTYVIGATQKAVAAGFHVVRLNVRGSGGTERLARRPYHSGLTADVDAVVRDVLSTTLGSVYLAGFSMGGNQVLKLLGEWAGAAPSRVRGAVVVSSVVDVEACSTRIDTHRGLLPYRWRFLRDLVAYARAKADYYPHEYDIDCLRGLRTIRAFDEVFTVPAWGFADAGDYYRSQSALPWVERVRVPTLAINARDDVLVPIAGVEEARARAAAAGANVRWVLTNRGGHVSFVGAGSADGDVDRHWAENRIVSFCRDREREVRAS